MKKLIVLLAMTLSVSAMAIDYQCAGTEPFWGMTIKGDKLSYDYSADEPVNKTEKIVSKKLMAARPEAFGVVAKTKNVTATVILNDQCSDGMSDEIYSHSVALDVRGLSGVLEGCCNEIPAEK